MRLFSLVQIGMIYLRHEKLHFTGSIIWAYFVILLFAGVFTLVSIFHLLSIALKVNVAWKRLKLLNITDLAVLITWSFGPATILLLISSELVITYQKSQYLIYCTICRVYFVVTAILRFILTVFGGRYLNKMSKVNEANEVGDDYTFILLMALFCKEYQRL